MRGARRRAVIAIALAAFAMATAQARPVVEQAPPRDARNADLERQRAEDFDAMWRAIDSGYAYFEPDDTAWRRARVLWRARAIHARTRREFIEILERALATLQDANLRVAPRSPESPRRIPRETDIWARWKDGAAGIEDVRTYSDADIAGLRPGDVVTRIDGEAIDEAVQRRAGANADAALRDRVLRELLAGPRFGTLRLTVRQGDRTRDLAIARATVPAAGAASILARRMGDARDLGYIRVKDGASDDGLLGELDTAITLLRGTRGLILDLRETAGPISRATTEAILARFAPAGTPWQSRESRSRGRIVDRVPAGHRSPPYDAPIVVLTDRWTEGEAEALAAGVHEAAHALVIGTPAAGLHGDLRSLTLPHSRATVRFPAERTWLLDGRPREALVPDLPVDLAAPSGGPGDPILYQALKAFEKGGPLGAAVR